MYERFTDRARKVMQLASQEAQRFNHEYIGTEHILLGLVKEGSGVAANVLKNLDIDLRKVRQELEKIVQAGPPTSVQGNRPQTPRAKKVIDYAIEEARNLNHNYVGTEHLLLGLLREEEGVAGQVLMNLGTGLKEVREEVLSLLGQSSGQREAATVPAGGGKGKTPALDCFGRDLTELARQGKLDPCIGRAAELERLLQVLSCRDRNNPLLVGESGVGKTALVEGLAQRIVEGTLPPTFAGRRIVTPDLARMAFSLKLVEKFSDCIQAILNEARRANDVLLFFDGRLHPLARHGFTRAIELANQALLSALVRGELQCIAAVTPEQYRDLWTAPIFQRCFEPVVVQPPSRREAVEILRASCIRFEEHHHVVIQHDAVEAAVELCLGPAGGTCLPGEAIALLDQAAAGVRLRAAPAAPDLRDLDAELERRIQDKEAAVAEGDFERAAALRDQTDKLKKRREQIVRQWREQTHATEGTVDRAAVAAAAARRDPKPPS